jgi:hypothetical protein
VRWYEEMAARHAVEDEQRLEEMRDRLDDEMQLDPVEAFQPRSTNKAAELRRADRERQRQASLRRDKMRDQGSLSGWRAYEE